MTQVNLHQLSKQYGNTKAVRDLTLDVPSGKIMAFLGPSGCGKTTTLKMIAGLLQPTKGDILFDGQSVLPVPPERRGAAMVFQNHLLFPYMSVGDNVGFGLKMRKVDRRTIRRKVSEMLDFVKLSGFEKRRPNQLSGGQQQRVALARALIIEPNVLLLDEPLSNLDAHLRDEMRDLILNIQRQFGITAIFVTHDQEEAVILADQIALLFDGQLQQFGEPRAFYERPATVKVVRFFGGVNFITGTKRDKRVETALGPFQLPSMCNLDDGPVILTIRPENVMLSINKHHHHNVIEGRILSHLYAGTHTRFKVAAKTSSHSSVQLEVISDAASGSRFCEGELVFLHLPPEKMWVMPQLGE